MRCGGRWRGWGMTADGLAFVPPADWTTTTVGELAQCDQGTVQTGPFGSQLHASDYVDEGVPSVMPQDLVRGRIDESNIARISREDRNRLSRYVLRPGDVVYSRRGDLRRRALVTDGQEGWLCGTGCLMIRTGAAVVPGWLFYALGHPAIQEWIERHAVGATMPNLNTALMSACPLPFPPPGEQQAIAAVLATLDEKIESNRRTAEAAGRCLSAAAPRQGTPTALSDVGRFENGGALTRVANGLGRPILRIRELRTGVRSDTPRTDAEVRVSQVVGFGDLLFSWSGTLLTRRWTGEDSVLNQHVFRVSPINGYPTWLVEAWIQQHIPVFRRVAADKATTMGHIQRHHLDQAQVLIPEPDELARLDTRWTPLDELRLGLLAENRSLTAIRDALLPKLVSGQIRVPLSDDSEEQMGVGVEALA